MKLRLDRIHTDINILASVNGLNLSKVSGGGIKTVNVGVENTYQIIVTAEGFDNQNIPNKDHIKK